MLPDYSALVKAIKKAGTEAVDASGPVTICFGKVEVNVFRFFSFLLTTIPQCIK